MRATFATLPEVPKDQIEYIADLQGEQSRMLRELTSGMARVETRVDGLADRLMNADREQTLRLDDVEDRLTAIDHERTATRTTIRVLGALLTAIASCVGWILSR